ncbi:MAG: transcription antitermination factor NusB [bacterium]
MLKKQQPKRIDSRHESRRILVQALFAFSFFEKRPLSVFIDQFLNEFPPVVYDRKLLEQVGQSISPALVETDQLIEKAAPEWPVDQIAKIDLAVLRLSVYEMAIARSIPYKVAIDEAVELAKEFGGETSSKFVNGVLGTIAREQGVIVEDVK